jgi:hypothetical protein
MFPEVFVMKVQAHDGATMHDDWALYVLQACAHVNLVLSHEHRGLLEQPAAVLSTAQPCWHTCWAEDQRHTRSELHELMSE